MKTRRSMLSRIWSKCFPSGSPSQADAGKPQRLARADGSGKPAAGSSRPPRSGIEMLEGRIAPATLINPSTVMFVDIDGDEVTVQFSKPIFTQTGPALDTLLNNVFKFNTGTTVAAGGANADPGTPQQLQLIDLTQIPLVGTAENATNPAAGISITVTANKADTLKPGAAEGEAVRGQDGVLDGDGLTNIGAIRATHATSNDFSFGLGKVTIDGDLGQIDAGGIRSKVGIASLNVHSLGAVAGTQQAADPATPAAAAASLESKIIGSLGSLTVETDMKGYINVVTASGSNPIAIGKIGNVTIGGTLHGGALENSGTIQSATSIGKIQVGSGEIVTPPPAAAGESESTTSVGTTDGIKGGAGKNTGAIVAGGTIKSIVIDGDLHGGGGENSGTIRATGDIGTVKIGTGVAGHGIVGGAGSSSGSIQGSAKLVNISVDGDLLGGTGAGSGSIVATGAIGKVMIDGKVDTVAEEGSVVAGANSARIYSKGDLGNVTITGNLEGGSKVGTGTIRSDGKMGVINIGGDLLGGGAEAGGIFAGGNLEGVVIDGHLKGGTGTFSGFIQGAGDIGFVKIALDLDGTTTTAVDRAAIITANGSLGEVNIGGSVIGGKGLNSGAIHAGLSGEGNLGKVTIGKQLRGGEGFGSGVINSGASIGSVTINGTGNAVAVQGALGDFSASIVSAGTIGSVKITGAVQGGEGDYSGSLRSQGLMSSVTITDMLEGGDGLQSGSIYSADNWEKDLAGDLGKVNIGRILKAGEGAGSGSIMADGNVKTLTFGGIEVPLLIEPGARSAMVATGLGFVNPGDVGKITVTGSLDGGGDNHTLLEIHGSLGSLAARGGIANGDIHIAGNLGKLTVGVPGRNGVEANMENVVLTAGGIAPASVKVATAIASITVNGDVTGSQILAGYNIAGAGTNADAQIGTVKVSGNWTASDLVAGILAVNGEFGDADDAVISGGSDAITSRIANVIISGTVSGTSDLDTDHFGFVAQQIGKFKSGGAALPADVTVREVAIA